jgi:hypothetical protein
MEVGMEMGVLFYWRIEEMRRWWKCMRFERMGVMRMVWHEDGTPC